MSGKNEINDNLPRHSARKSTFPLDLPADVIQKLKIEKMRNTFLESEAGMLRLVENSVNTIP